MSPALLALTTIAALLGVLVMIVGVMGGDRDRSAQMPRRLRARFAQRPAALSGRRLILLVAGIAAGIVGWLATGWIVAVIALPAAAFGLPLLLGKGNTGAAVDRLDALETWTRSLGGLTMGGMSLERTIAASLGSAPPAIAPEITTLVARINARWSTETALQAFADDLADPTADLVVAHLKLAAKMRGDGLANALNDLADTIFDEVRVRRQIDTDRAKPRQTVRIITITTLAALCLIPLMGQFVEPYRTPVGQIGLAVWLLLYAVVLIWLKRITVVKQTPRILANPLSTEATR